MAQAGPIPISYIPTSRGPVSVATQRHLAHAESPLASLVRRTSSRRVQRNRHEQDPQQQENFAQPPRIAVQTTTGQTIAVEEDGEDWRTDAYASYEPSDTESAYDYNYTLTPSEPDTQFYNQQQQRGSPNSGQYAHDEWQNQPGPSTQRAPSNTGGDSSVQTQCLLTDLRIDVPPAGGLAANSLHSPLLHGHFTRDSQATASEYSNWDASTSMRSSTHSDATYSRSPSRTPDPPSPLDADTRAAAREQFPFQGAGPGSPTASSRYSDAPYDQYEYYEDDAYGRNPYSSNGADAPALRDSWRSTASDATVRRPDYYMPSPGNLRDGDGAGWGAGRAPVVKPVTNFSRPVRESGVPAHAEAQGERVTPQLPPDMHAQKQKVLERNARPGGAPASMRATVVEEALASNNLHPNSQTSVRPGTNRMVTPASSVFSNYSYYPYSSAAPSPVDGAFPQQSGPPSPALSKTEAKPSGPQTPQDYLQLGIQHHEANRLPESARCFERSAKEGGGCGVGMLMYGLTLRHGWGCGKNEKMAFKWLMKAAECAVEDLERMRKSGGEGAVGVVETELVLAIYEVGQCFFHGWGVVKDQKMAVVREFIFLWGW